MVHEEKMRSLGDYTGWDQCFLFPSMHWHCWLGDIHPVNKRLGCRWETRTMLCISWNIGLMLYE